MGIIKKMLNINNFNDRNNTIAICSYCTRHCNDQKIPPRSKLNNMDPGEVPREIADLTPIELMFISQVKVFQTVIKLGAVGKHAPQHSRLSALKGNAIHMPLPLEQTIKQLEEETDFTKIPANYIITHHIKENDELILRNLVDLDKVYEALVWLKKYNDSYKHIKIPINRELLFSSVLSKESSVPTHTTDSTLSCNNDSGLDQAGHDLRSSNISPIQNKNTGGHSKDTDIEVQNMSVDTRCHLPGNKETEINVKDPNEGTVSHELL